MPLYSLIALVLSVFGATYTALGALRSYYDADVRQTNDIVDKRILDIKTKANESLLTAERYGGCVKFWAKIWKWSYSVPIVFFLAVVFAIGIFSLLNWDQVIHPLSFLSAQTPPLSTEEIAKEKQAWEHCCRGGWWLLLIVLVVNGTCSISALLARRYVKSNGRHLTEIHFAAEQAYAKSQVEEN